MFCIEVETSIGYRVLNGGWLTTVLVAFVCMAVKDWVCEPNICYSSVCSVLFGAHTHPGSPAPPPPLSPSGRRPELTRAETDDPLSLCVLSINHWYLYWPPNASDIAPGEILRQVSESLLLVMSFGNQKFGIPRKYQHQIGILYFCSKFLGIFFVFYRYFEKALLKIWLKIYIFCRIKICLVFGFCSCHLIDIGLASVSNFPENGSSN